MTPRVTHTHTHTRLVPLLLAPPFLTWAFRTRFYIALSDTHTPLQESKKNLFCPKRVLTESLVAWLMPVSGKHRKWRCRTQTKKTVELRRNPSKSADRRYLRARSLLAFRCLPDWFADRAGFFWHVRRSIKHCNLQWKVALDGFVLSLFTFKKLHFTCAGGNFWGLSCYLAFEGFEVQCA